jgi:hypothetical protein
MDNINVIANCYTVNFIVSNFNIVNLQIIFSGYLNLNPAQTVQLQNWPGSMHECDWPVTAHSTPYLLGYLWLLPAQSEDTAFSYIRVYMFSMRHYPEVNMDIRHSLKCSGRYLYYLLQYSVPCTLGLNSWASFASHNTHRLFP